MEKTNEPLDVYVYGMTVYSTLHKLDAYPEPDTYGEITETSRVSGGEAGNSAIILASLGCKVRLDGPFLGTQTQESIQAFMKPFGVDCSLLTMDPTYEGVQDMVLIAGNTRTVFGTFAHFFSGLRRWNKPDEASIALCAMVALDPFFKEESLEAARICARLGKPYVTIDCPYDGELSKHAAAIAVSHEYMKNQYPEMAIPQLFSCYTAATDGLVVFTFGGREILFGRKRTGMNRVLPYKVEVKSTLGAGDTFRAGIVYGLLHGFDDEKTVRFAAATAAMVCTRFPFAYNPPGLTEILALMEGA